MSSGVIFSTKSLVLQGVTRRDGGLYTCSAANQIGEATSQAVYLRVQCKLDICDPHRLLVALVGSGLHPPRIYGLNLVIRSSC